MILSDMPEKAEKGFRLDKFSLQNSMIHHKHITRNNRLNAKVYLEI